MITEFNQDRKRVFRIESQSPSSLPSVNKLNNNINNNDDKYNGGDKISVSTATEQKAEKDTIHTAPVSTNNIKITSDSYA